MRSNWDDGRKRRYRSGSPWLPFDWSSIPVTRGILIAALATFLTFFFTGQMGGIVWQLVPFQVTQWYKAWTWFTYPFLEIPSLFTIFTVLILYQIGGSLERSWGSLNYLVLFLAVSALSALAFVPATLLLNRPMLPLLGFDLPLVAMVTAWAALDPDLKVCYWGLQVRAKTIALIFAFLIYVQIGMALNDPLIAAFCFVGPLLAFLYVRKMPRLNLGRPSFSLPRRPRTERPPRLMREEFMDEDDLPGRERVPGSSRNPLRRRQEQMEIERLKKLLGEDD